MRPAKFKEYDCFRLSMEIGAEAIPIDTIGVVLMVFEKDPPQYEVEFVDDNGGNLGSSATYTLDEGFMAPLDSPK